MSAGSVPYCGDMTMSASSFLKADPNGGIPALFEGRQVRYTFNTRVAIREACDLLGLKPGDEVLAPAYNCGSELDPLRHAGLTITLYPVDRKARIDLAGVEACISAKTRAVYLTHYFGFIQPDAAPLRALCDQHGLFLIEDCALSLLSGGTPAEGFSGDISVFCFYKFFPVLGGGALVINNKNIKGNAVFSNRAPWVLVNKQRIRLGLGMLIGSQRVSALKRTLRKETSLTVDVVQAGLPDMPPHYYFDPRLRNTGMDFFASRPLRSFNTAKIIRTRRKNYRIYLNHLSEIDGVEPLFPDLPNDICPLSVPVLLENRDKVAQALISKGIAATPWWSGYNQHLNWGKTCADARYLKDHTLSLPVHQHLGKLEISYITTHLQNSISTTA